MILWLFLFHKTISRSQKCGLNLLGANLPGKFNRNLCQKSANMQGICSKLKNQENAPKGGARFARAPFGYIFLYFLNKFLAFLLISGTNFCQIFLADWAPSRFSPHFWLVEFWIPMRDLDPISVL